MITVILITLACKGGPVGADDSSGGADDTAPAVDSEPVEVPAGEDFALVSGTNLVAFFNAELAIPSTSEASLTLAESAAWTALADFDGDGLDDVWQIPDGRAKVFVYPNSGDATVPTEAVFEPSTGLVADLSWLAGDFNGDGLDDIAQLNGNDRFIFLPNAVGLFDSEGRVATDTTFAQTGALSTGDVDGDGTDDLLYFKDGELRVYRVVAGAPESSPLITLSSPVTATHALLLDVDDDGLGDLALWSGSTLRLYPNTGGAFDVSSEQSVSINRSGTPLAGELR
ncbi:MAG: VCBS repeat-containing protein [Alphaproteobacteria bacterium]|nr:VCBS repeat-containing protein [Alphaproteobacteria bacterium]MCB9797514.1 VCBS repeat-containing protein [Alphaproteobacteria bacterium]